MLNRSYFVRVVELPALGAALFLASTLVATSSETRARLDEQTLAWSRGSNLGSTLFQNSCNTRNGNGFCKKEDDDCVSCTKQTYADVTPDAIGGYRKSGAASCGDNWSGKCNDGLQCDTSKGSDVGNCAPPNAVFVQ